MSTLKKALLRFKAWWYDWPVWRVQMDGFKTSPKNYKTARFVAECSRRVPEFDYDQAEYYNNI